MEAFSRLSARINKGVGPTPSLSAASNAPRPSPAASTTSTKLSTAEPLSVVPRRPPVQSWPIQLESPRYKIRVTVYYYFAARVTNHGEHTPTEIYVWTFISSGLRAVAGGELILVIKRRPNETPESYPTDFLRMCDSVYDRASTQRLMLKRWKLIELDEALFERPDFKTIVLGLRNSPLFGMGSVSLNKDAAPLFYCLALSDQETAAARKVGVVRVLVSGTERSPWFPFPFYVDRDREVKVTASAIDSSVLANGGFNKFEVTGLNVIHARSGQVTLHIPQDRVAEFKTAMLGRRNAPLSSLLIEAEIHDACTCVYLWSPGVKAIARTMTNQEQPDIAANFLLLSFNQASEGVKLIEDGVLVLMSPANTARFFRAACQGQNMTLTLGHFPFHISWPPSWPVPACSNTSSSAGRMYLPVDGGAEHYDRDHVKVDLVLLHEPPTQRANIKLMVDFLKKAEAAIIAAIPEEKPAMLPQGCCIIAQFRIPQVDINSFQLLFDLPSNEALSAVPANKLWEIIHSLEVPAGIVYGDYVEWQLRFSCWGFESGKAR